MYSGYLPDNLRAEIVIPVRVTSTGDFYSKELGYKYKRSIFEKGSKSENSKSENRIHYIIPIAVSISYLIYIKSKL